MSEQKSVLSQSFMFVRVYVRVRKLQGPGSPRRLSRAFPALRFILGGPAEGCVGPAKSQATEVTSGRWLAGSAVARDALISSVCRVHFQLHSYLPRRMFPRNVRMASVGASVLGWHRLF